MSPIRVSRRNVLGLTAAAAVAATATAGFAYADTPTSPSGDIVDWIDRKAHPLRTTDPTRPLDDLRALRHIAGGASVVGLGEASHGSRELFRVKHRMARYLVERMGFRTIGFEQDFAWGTLIDRYVMTGEGDPRKLLFGMSSPLWNSEEILDLITWMRSYNEENRDKVRFLGTDLLKLHDLSHDKVTEVVTRVAADRLPELKSDLDPLRLHGEYRDHFEWYGGRSVAEQRALMAQGAAVVELLDSLDIDSDDIDGEYARQHARAIAGWYEYYSKDTSLRRNRERFVADTIAWWKRVRGGKLAYWAANVHTCAAAEATFAMPGETSTGAWAGRHLRERFGRRYVSIGTAFGEGTITSGWQPPAPCPVAPPSADLLEAVLGEAEAPDYLLDLRQRGPRPVRGWLSGPVRTRMIHPVYDGEDASGHTLSADAFDELFDAIVHIRTTTASRWLG